MDRKLPASIQRGDQMAVFTAGAYGMSMASTYNSHLLPAEVLVSGSTASLIRPRENMLSLYHSERTPTSLVLDGVSV